jgi:hypothetical protein
MCRERGNERHRRVVNKGLIGERGRRKGLKKRKREWIEMVKTGERNEATG